MDPEASIEVIVQFKNAAGASELVAEGATAKSDLPFVHGQLVTVKGGSLSNLAVIDSGISSTYDLNSDDNQSSHIAYNESFVPGDFSSGDPFGHGRHIAGIIAGNAYASSTSYYPGV